MKHEEQEAFEASPLAKHLDLTKVEGGWREDSYSHSHVDAIWAGWKARAALAALRPLRPAEALPPEVAPLTGRELALKIDSPVFVEVATGVKLFEIRKDDREYQCGDVLVLRETKFTGLEMAAGEPLIYTGRAERRRVVGLLRGPQYGLAAGWVILSIAPLADGQQHADVRPLQSAIPHGGG
jgi:hypothetical protein